MTAALHAVLVRIVNARAKIAGGSTATVPASASVEDITAALESEAATLTAGRAPASLEEIVSRIESALAKALGKAVGSSAASNDPEQLTARLEQLASMLPGASTSGSSSSAQVTPAPVAAAAPTPAAAPVAAAVVAPAAAAPPAVVPAAVAPAGSEKTYTYAELKGARLPDVNWAQREQRLTDAEFATVFKISRAEFNALPGWKRDEKKKAVGLF